MSFNPTKPLRILIVENDLTSRTQLHQLLSESPLLISETKFTQTLKATLGILDENDFDVVLLNLNLPDTIGLNTLLKVTAKCPLAAIIVIADQQNEELELEAIASGAQEYLVKGCYDLETLTKSVRYALERKSVNKKLSLAEQKYRLIFENSAVAITVVDEYERLVSWNKFAENLLGMNASDLYLKPVKSLYPIAEWEKIKIKNIRQKGIQEHIETQMLKKDGNIINVNVSLSILKDCEGKITGSIGIIRDITDHIKIQQIIDRKQKSLEAIFDAVPVGMMLLNNDLAVKRVNNSVREIVKEDYLQILGLRFGNAIKCFHSTYDSNLCGHNPACKTCLLQQAIKNVFDSWQPQNIEFHPTLKIENKKITPWFDINITPVIIDDDKHIVIALDDITSKKITEQKIKETMELKSQFISTVSHELRTPLAAMKEGVIIVLDEVTGPINEKQKKFLNIAKRNVDRLGDLINNVLDVQKFEAGKMDLDIQNNDIKDVVLEVHETMDLSAKKKEIKLLLDYELDLPEAKFDRSKIIQVLINLIGNAIKFTHEKGQVSVNVRHNKQELIISVSDNGMGIPKDALLKVFDQFYRVNRPGKEIQGTGLGLSIVKRIVMMHGGRIEVESELNKGTTFRIFLPLACSSSPDISSDEVDAQLENILVKNKPC
ncbi:MAG TPA: ATP-binding protein [Sedimentisphaerales bacterium]|nr:ATP-binding protein [Sedimentisphaerales bacterium]